MSLVGQGCVGMPLDIYSGELSYGAGVRNHVINIEKEVYAATAVDALFDQGLYKAEWD